MPAYVCLFGTSHQVRVVLIDMKLVFHDRSISIHKFDGNRVNNACGDHKSNLLIQEFVQAVALRMTRVCMILHLSATLYCSLFLSHPTDKFTLSIGPPARPASRPTVIEEHVPNCAKCTLQIQYKGGRLCYLVLCHQPSCGTRA